MFPDQMGALSNIYDKYCFSKLWITFGWYSSNYKKASSLNKDQLIENDSTLRQNQNQNQITLWITEEQEQNNTMRNRRTRKT